MAMSAEWYCPQVGPLDATAFGWGECSSTSDLLPRGLDGIHHFL
jgi:hypothetical protein